MVVCVMALVTVGVNAYGASASLSVYNVFPVGTIYESSPSVGGSYTATEGTLFIDVSVDGVYMQGCEVTGDTYNGTIECVVSDLSWGDHQVVVSVIDNNWNQVIVQQDFRVEPANCGGVTYAMVSPNEGAVGNGYWLGFLASVDHSCVSSVSVTVDGVHAADLVPYGDYMVRFNSYFFEKAEAGQYEVVFTPDWGPVMSKSFTFSADTVAPVISGVTPSGVINTDDANIEIWYEDPAPSVGVSGAEVYLDGSPINCAAAYYDHAVCYVTGLTEGDHTVAGTISDHNGNSSAFEGGFSVCLPSKPLLSLSKMKVYWGSYAEYVERMLSIDYNLRNKGTKTAFDVGITNSTGSNGVVCASDLPVSVGDIAASASAQFTLLYTIPPGAASFSAKLYASASDSCGVGHSYP